MTLFGVLIHVVTAITFFTLICRRFLCAMKKVGTEREKETTEQSAKIHKYFITINTLSHNFNFARCKTERITKSRALSYIVNTETFTCIQYKRQK